MKKLAIVVSAWLIVNVASATPALSGEAGKWCGYLIDRQCADSVKEDNDPKAFIEHHTKDCVLMVNCTVKGFAIYVTPKAEAKWLDLDKKGNELAAKLLKSSKRKRGFYVEVTGKQENTVLKTQTIKEIDEPKAQ
jgi:hypothetical protein